MATSKPNTEYSLVKNGTLIYYSFLEWQGRWIRVKIGCECGGESGIFATRCVAPTDPRYLYEIVGICGQCQRELCAWLFFYQSEVLCSDAMHYFSFGPWRGLDLPIRLKCNKSSCPGESDDILVSCLPGEVAVTGICQECQATLSAAIRFEIS